MTHDELVDIAIVKDLNKLIRKQMKAIDTVFELHKQDVRGNCDLCTWITNGGLVLYPCPTIRAIEKELQ